MHFAIDPDVFTNQNPTSFQSCIPVQSPIFTVYFSVDAENGFFISQGSFTTPPNSTCNFGIGNHVYMVSNTKIQGCVCSFYKWPSIASVFSFCCLCINKVRLSQYQQQIKVNRGLSEWNISLSIL